MMCITIILLSLLTICTADVQAQAPGTSTSPILLLKRTSPVYPSPYSAGQPHLGAEYARVQNPIVYLRNGGGETSSPLYQSLSRSIGKPVPDLIRGGVARQGRAGLHLFQKPDRSIGFGIIHDEAPRSGFLLSLGGVAGFGVGLAAGTMVGHAIDHDYQDSWIPVTDEMMLGAIAGGAVGAPLGVHLTNRRRGNLWLAGLASAAIASANVPLLERLSPLVLALPLAQIAASAIIERLTTH